MPNLQTTPLIFVCLFSTGNRYRTNVRRSISTSHNSEQRVRSRRRMGDRCSSCGASTFGANNRSSQTRSFGSYDANVGNAGVTTHCSYLGSWQFLSFSERRCRQLPGRIVLSQSSFTNFAIFESPNFTNPAGKIW